MPIHTPDCPCALSCVRIKAQRHATLGSSDQYPRRALHCYYVARAAEFFRGLPSVDWARIHDDGYASAWVQRCLTQVPHPSIILRRIRCSQVGLDGLEFDVQLELCESARSERTARFRRNFFETWITTLSSFLDAAEAEVYYSMY